MPESNKNYLENHYLLIFNRPPLEKMDQIERDPDRIRAFNMLQDYVSSCRNKLSDWPNEHGLGDQIHLREPRVLNWLFMECPKEYLEELSSYPEIKSITKLERSKY